MFWLFFAFLYAQEKVLLEQGKAEKPSSIQSEELSLSTDAVTVVIANTDDIPDYFVASHVLKPLTEILKERETLVCENAGSGHFGCYSCKQENDKFLFSFEFSKSPSSSECVLSRYAVQLKTTQKQEETVIRFLQKMGLAVDAKNFSTPMVFEKPPLQINLKLNGSNLAIDFLEPDSQALRTEFDSKYNFLTLEVAATWPQYVSLTEQYLVEVGVNRKGLLNTNRAMAVTSNAEFVNKFKKLKEEAAKITNKEERACFIFENDFLLSQPVQAEAVKDLNVSVKSSWGEMFEKDLKDTVCGNFYFLQQVKRQFQQTACTAFNAAQKAKDLESFLTKNINILERKLANLFLSTLKIKMIYQDTMLTEDKKQAEIFKQLQMLEQESEIYRSYVAFKKKQWNVLKPELELFRCAQ